MTDHLERATVLGLLAVAAAIISASTGCTPENAAVRANDLLDHVIADHDARLAARRAK
jgi:hypothetical protein